MKLENCVEKVSKLGRNCGGAILQPLVQHL